MRTKGAGLAAAFGLSLFLSGCFYYPRTVQYYDPGCEIQARRMELKSKVIDATCSGGSSHEGAAACLAFYLSMTAGSAVVSGSIVVVGNTVYWFEKRGRCARKSTFT
jgi:hypothetical protein